MICGMSLLLGSKTGQNSQQQPWHDTEINRLQFLHYLKKYFKFLPFLTWFGAACNSQNKRQFSNDFYLSEKIFRKISLHFTPCFELHCNTADTRGRKSFTGAVSVVDRTEPVRRLFRSELHAVFVGLSKATDFADSCVECSTEAEKGDEGQIDPISSYRNSSTLFFTGPP
ncbi:hypothetical protein CEXT_144631 [Caerostris extrusa]|uniref:Uncharacterized protein n=1 Tax=Caerostris extrusa TaxID=172846 RepID=A0AAV4XLM7_CAEEX|nr:hypothetical protein CEXT_144631 [Caerostris extrusa]